MEAFLEYGFLQRALLAGIFIGLACALLGLFLVLRKDAMVGHGLSHLAFAGVAVGLFLSLPPLAAALAVCVLTALIIMKIKSVAGLHGDTAIGIFSSVGLAAGILLVSLARNFNVDLMGYLFGEILAVTHFEVWLSVGLAGGVLAALLLNYSRLLYITFDRESAQAAGVKVQRLETLLTVLTAVTIVLGMKVVGIMLVAALLVIPAAGGLQVARSFRMAMAVSAAAAVVSIAAGMASALEFNIPASAAIVLIAFAVFVGLLILGKIRK
jgi:zinc transport system permease protein